MYRNTKSVVASVDDTVLINDIVLDKAIVHIGMPTKVENAKLPLVNAALALDNTEMSAAIRLSLSLIHI